MPNAVATLTIMVPPGKVRNFTLAIFAASPPVGAGIGALMIGAFLEYSEWKWHFISVYVCRTLTFSTLDTANWILGHLLGLFVSLGFSLFYLLRSPLTKAVTLIALASLPAWELFYYSLWPGSAFPPSSLPQAAWHFAN